MTAFCHFQGKEQQRHNTLILLEVAKSFFEGRIYHFYLRSDVWGGVWKENGQMPVALVWKLFVFYYSDLSAPRL